MKHGASNHPKMLALARTLGISRREAVGIMSLIWEWVGDYAMQGDIGKFTNQDIAQVVDWQLSDADNLVRAMVHSGFLEESDEHRLIVHDWHDHCEAYIRKRLERAELRFISNGRQRRTTAAKGRQGQPLDGSREVLALATAQATSGQEGGVGETDLPPALNTPEFRTTWELWQQHRREKKKPLTPASRNQQLEKLTEMGHDRAIRAIKHSVAGGWTGIFEPDDSRAGSGTHRLNSPAAAQARRADEAGRLLAGNPLPLPIERIGGKRTTPTADTG